MPKVARKSMLTSIPDRGAESAIVYTPADLAAAREQQQRLLGQVVALRAQFQESIAYYSVRVQGLLAIVGDVLDEDLRMCTSAEQIARVTAIRLATEHINAMKIKPSRGRRRDLKAIEDVADELTSLVAEW